MKGFNDIIQQAQQMQEKMQKMQEQAANVEVQGQSGAGMVKVNMTGRYDVRNVEIDSALLGEDKEILEDLVAAAVNDAVRKVEANNRDTLGDLAAGIQLPPGFKMPF